MATDKEVKKAAQMNLLAFFMSKVKLNGNG